MKFLERDQTLYRPKSQDATVFGDVPRMLKDAFGGPGERVLDVGCHIGYFSVLAKRAGSEVLAYDADRDIVSVAMANAERHGFRAVHSAIGPQDGEVQVFPSPRNLMSNQVTTTFFKKGRTSTYSVPMRSFRDVVSEFRPTIIKCDIEGFEYELDWTGLPDHVHTVALEFHTPRPAWCMGLLEVRQQLVDQDFGLVFSSINPFRWETTWRRGAEKQGVDPITDRDFVEVSVEWIQRMRKWLRPELCAHEEVFS